MDNTKTCPVCNAPVKGRIDKVYCSVKCKSIAQYEQRQTAERFYLEVDRQLKTNRRILKKYNRGGMATIRQEKLHAEGFDPSFSTHIWQNAKGGEYRFVYDYGFLCLDHHHKPKYLIVKWQDYMKI